MTDGKVDVLAASEVLAPSTTRLYAPVSYADWSLGPGRFVSRPGEPRTNTPTGTASGMPARLYDTAG